MKLEYKIEENDFLDFQLFTASKSERINKKKKNGWLSLTIGAIIVGVYFYLNQNILMAIYFGLVSLACGLFYPKYFKWRYKKHYKAYITENYSKRFGLTEIIEINDDFILSKDKTGEGKIKLAEIEKIDETGNHFFLKVSTGMSLIIPKDRISSPNILRVEFEKLGLKINNERNWKWK